MKDKRTEAVAAEQESTTANMEQPVESVLSKMSDEVIAVIDKYKNDIDLEKDGFLFNTIERTYDDHCLIRQVLMAQGSMLANMISKMMKENENVATVIKQVVIKHIADTNPLMRMMMEE